MEKKKKEMKTSTMWVFILISSITGFGFFWIDQLLFNSHPLWSMFLGMMLCSIVSALLVIMYKNGTK